jgi:conjugal transfer pilus assembly protein TraF
MANFNDTEAEGFHWYTSKPEAKPVKPQSIVQAPSTTTTITKMQPYQELHYLSLKTKNTLSTALLHPTVENTARYMYAQQFWAKQDQKFVRTWQQALLKHPDLDYTLNYPTDNNAIPVRNDERKILIEKTLKEMPSHYGLILFYQGSSSVCQKFVSLILTPFIKQYPFSMISVTTDRQPIIGLPNPKNIPIQAIEKVMQLKPRYLPALFLVNLRSKKMQALSYGFISSGDLKERFLDVMNNFKRFSYKGIGEKT